MIWGANRADSHETIRANRIAEKKPISHNVRAVRANRLKPSIRNLLVHGNAIRNKVVQLWNFEMICANRAIRANLRIDSRESGHLSFGIFLYVYVLFFALEECSLLWDWGALYMGKTGTIWQFFRALFPSTWRTLSPDALFTRIWDTRKHPESATFSCFPC